MSDLTARPGRKSKARRRSRAHKQRAANDHTTDEPERAAPGSLTRTKSLLLAALRVWELKQRVGEFESFQHVQCPKIEKHGACDGITLRA